MQIKPLFTLDKLNQLTNGDKIAMTHFNSVFVAETVDKDLVKLRLASDHGDFLGIQKTAHKMKSSIDLYEINVISNVVKDIESMAVQQKDLDKIQHLVALVEDTLHKVRDEMNNLD